MAYEPYLGEIQIFAFGFAPKNWTPCNGQILSIAQNQALFSLLGTTYGGDGVTTFALPDLRGRTAISSGQGQGLTNRTLGEKAGEAGHTLITTEIPAHTHSVNGVSNDGDNGDPTGRYPATGPSGLGNTYGPATNTVQMSTAALGIGGGGQSHENQQPYLVLNFCIALVGVYPSRN